MPTFLNKEYGFLAGLCYNICSVCPPITIILQVVWKTFFLFQYVILSCTFCFIMSCKNEYISFFIKFSRSLCFFPQKLNIPWLMIFWWDVEVYHDFTFIPVIYDLCIKRGKFRQIGIYQLSTIYVPSSIDSVLGTLLFCLYWEISTI